MDLEGDKKDIINREIKFFRDLHKVRNLSNGMSLYFSDILQILEIIIFILGFFFSFITLRQYGFVYSGSIKRKEGTIGVYIFFLLLLKTFKKEIKTSVIHT